MEIVKFIPEYAQALSDIICENLYKINIKDYDIKDIEDMSRKHTASDILNYASTRHMLVAVIDNLPVGTASAYKSENDENEFCISTYFVLPTLHGRGIGRKLFYEIEEYAKKNQGKCLTVFASISAVRFYELMGFEFILESKIAPDGQNYPMIKYII